MKPQLPNTEYDKIKNSDSVKYLIEGKQAMSKSSFEVAIEYFNETFNTLQEKWWEVGLSDHEFQILIECSYLIGVCCYELELFDRAYKYLHFAGEYSNLYLAKYIDCIIALRDIQIFKIIDDYLDLLFAKKEEERTSDDYELCMFLLNRKAFCLIEVKAYKAAEDTLNYILKSDPENQYAKEWIEPVKQMRKEQEELCKEHPQPTPPEEEKKLLTNSSKNEYKSAFKTEEIGDYSWIPKIIIIGLLMAIIRYLSK